jgi:hypothetical protein
MSSQQASILDTGWQGFSLTGNCQIPDALPPEGGDPRPEVRGRPGRDLPIHAGRYKDSTTANAAAPISARRAPLLNVRRPGGLSPHSGAGSLPGS